MDNSYSDAALSLLKADLGFFETKIPSVLEDYLGDLLRYSQKTLREECGIKLTPDDIYDDQLLAMHAAWLYRNRATGAGKSPMLIDAIRNRQVRNAMQPAPAAGEGSA